MIAGLIDAQPRLIGPGEPGDDPDTDQDDDAKDNQNMFAHGARIGWARRGGKAQREGGAHFWCDALPLDHSVKCDRLAPIKL